MKEVDLERVLDELYFIRKILDSSRTLKFARLMIQERIDMLEGRAVIPVDAGSVKDGTVRTLDGQTVKIKYNELMALDGVDDRNDDSAKDEMEIIK